MMTTRTITLPADQWEAILEAVQDHWDEGPRGEGWQSSRLSAASAALSTALAQPEPEGATDEDLMGLDDLRDAWNAQADAVNSWDELGIDEIIWFAQQQALARWSRPTIAPAPVAERLPGPGDCDAEGRCWLLTAEDEYPQWRLHSIEGARSGGKTMIWVPVDSRGFMVDCFYASHWLPHHALPLPRQSPDSPYTFGTSVKEQRPPIRHP